MGDRLECTDIFQAHHDRVTAEVPITVSDDERLDMFPVATPDGCTQCGRSWKIGGRDETVMIDPAGGFQHSVCDDRWDP